MRLLIKNAGILASKDGTFDHIPEGFLGVDGDRIDYIGPSAPKNATTGRRTCAASC